MRRRFSWPARRRARRVASIAAMTPSGGRRPTAAEIEELFRLPDGVAVAPDGTARRWIEESLQGTPWATVRGLVPATFERYARVLHPAWIERQGEQPIRWADVATRTGRTAHRLMQFERIAALGDDPNAQPDWGRRPDTGSSCAIAGRLIDLLASHTATPDRICMAVWTGYGGLEMVPSLAEAPRIATPGREYLLLSGPIEAVPGFCVPIWQPPNIWWPEDRSWCVATEIDLDSTYVGGTASSIEGILADADLETYPSELDDAAHLGSDAINPA